MALVKKGIYRYILRRVGILACNLSEATVSGRYQLVAADANSLTQMRSLHPDEFSAKKLDDYLQRLEDVNEHSFLIGDEKGEIVGYTNVVYKDHFNKYSGFMVRLAADEVYYYDCYVFKAFRGQGAFQGAIGQMNYAAAKQGYRRALTMVEKRNTPSWRAFSAQGFKQVKVLWRFPLIKKNIVFKKR